jgi:hypothetical protein
LNVSIPDLRAAEYPVIAMIKKKMAELAREARKVEDEKLRTDLLGLIQSCLRALSGYRDWDELFEFVESSTDILSMGIATALYGHWDPRTQKIFDAAEERAIDRDHRRLLNMD